MAGGPALVEQIRPRAGRRIAEFAGDFGEASRSLFLNQRKKWREVAKQIPKFRIAGQRARTPVGRDGVDPLIQALLEAGYVNIEVEDFSSERVLGDELFSAPDALLPGTLCHRAIMGLPLAASNCRVEPI